MNMYAERIGKSNERVTQGRRYLIFDSYVKLAVRVRKLRSIVDNNTQRMEPRLDNPNYWIVVEKAGYPVTHLNPINYSNMLEAISLPILSKVTQTKKENTMLTITKPTLINGKNADSHTVDELLNFIEHEQARVDHLKNFKINSPAITKITEKHEENITALVGILETRKEFQD